MERWIFVVVQKDSNAKKKLIPVRTLQRLDQVYHSNMRKQKKEFFYRTNFFFPEARSWEFKVKTTEMLTNY
jgi:hypothetical protein